MGEEIRVSLIIPFPTKRAAQIAYDVLRIDGEPKRNHVKKTLKLNENNLEVELIGDIAKSVRVAVTNFFESLILCTETQNEFGPPVSEQFNHY